MKTKNLLLIVIIAIIAMTGFNALNAKTIYYVKVNGTGNGLSWTNAAGNIQDMIDKAVAADEVWVAAGTYSFTTAIQMKESVNVFGGFAGNETNIESRAKSDKDGNGKIEAWEFTNETVLSSTGVDIKVGNSETLFDGFTVTDVGITASGKAIVNNCFCNKIGISNNGGTISNSKVTNKSSSRTVTQSIVASFLMRGGGIDNTAGTIINCVVTNNSLEMIDESSVGNAYMVYGGGIYNDKGTVTNCIVTDNSCSVSKGSRYPHYTSGGGIYNNYGMVTNCIVANNSCNATTSSSSTPSYSHSYYADGGGIYNNYGTVSNCCVTNNFLYAKTSFSVPIYQRGGGIYNYGSSSDQANIYCSTVVKNSSYNATGPNPTDNIYTSNNGYSNVYNCISEDSNLDQNFVNPTSSFSTADWRLKFGSQYIDVGSLSNLPDWVIQGTDLAGKSRTHNGKISVGAYEYDSTVSAIDFIYSDKGINVYPNPAGNSIFIKFENYAIVKLFDTLGKEVLCQNVNRGKTEINISHLANGIYIVRIFSKDKVVGSSKIIKK